jgi:hypothetical protein
MASTQHQLIDTLNRIGNVLSANPEQHATFERWALLQLRLLVNAEKESRQALVWQAMEFRQEYLELQHELSMGIAVTGRTELLRSARREWLESVLALVEGLLEERRAA